MKKNISRMILTAVLALMSIGTWAQGRVAIATLQNGTITVGEVAATGNVTVTLTVTPATGYCITANDITVTKTASMAHTRAGGTPGYADAITVTAGTVDDTGKGTYTFALPDGYGAYVEATFNPAPEPETTIVVDVDASEAGNEGKTENNVKVVMTQSEGQEPTTEQRTVVNKETGKEETIEATVIPVAIEGVNIPANVESENISVTVPSEVVSGNVVYRVTEIKADAFKTPEGSKAKITKVVLPETKSTLNIAEGAMKPNGTLLDIETPLALLDDYTQMKSLKENYEAQKISSVISVDVAETGNEEKTVTGVTMVIKPSESQGETVEATVIPVAIEGINIPANIAIENITVTVPSQIVVDNVVYQVTEIKADAFKAPEGSKAKVTKVILPETESALIIAEGAMKPNGTLINIETSLALLDDYALMKTLKENFEALKISAHVTAPNKYWSFSSGVDCVLPDGVTAYIAEWNGMPRIIALEGDQLLLADGRRGIKANNGVLIAGTKGNVYEIVASSGNQQSGSTPVTTDAKSFEGNCLVPTIVATNYDAEKYLVLKDNTFHTIKSNSSKVKPCKAVFSLEKAGVK